MDEDRNLFQMFTAFVKQYKSGSSDAVIEPAKGSEGTGQAGPSQEMAQEDDDVSLLSLGQAGGSEEVEQEDDYASLHSGQAGGSQKVAQQDDDAMSLQSGKGICMLLHFLDQ